METGIYAGISNDAYHGGPGVSKSGLDLVARSPLHYWSRYLDPNREEREPTPAMRLGTAIHTAVLEPGEFAKRHHVAPAVDRRTKDGKATWEAAVDAAAAAGAELISNDDALTCMRIAEQVRQHPTARKVFATGQAEMSCYWTDAETGLLCKCRPDWLSMPLVVDLKSTDDASAVGFQRSAWTYRYWVQAAWYMDGVEQATGQRPDAFVFAAFEKAAPYACAFYFADDAMIEMGRAEYRKQLRVLADCIQSDTWPGYTTDVMPLGLPAWALAAAANDNQRGVV
jgi:exodeoxyribonuclease VIII